MTVHYGFFDSVDNDRLYNADSFNMFMDGFVTDGVLETVGGSFLVSANSGMTVTVAIGKAWFLKTWIYNDAPLNITAAARNPTYSRKDLIILDFDRTNRTNSVGILTGTPSASPVAPTLINTATRKQVPLAELWISSSDTEITANDITNKVGTTECPFCTSLLEHVTVDELLMNWSGGYSQWLQDTRDYLYEIDTTNTVYLIDNLNSRGIPGRNLIINGGMVVNQRNEFSISGYNQAASSLDKYPGIADRWSVDHDSPSGVYQLTRENISSSRGTKAFRIYTTTPATAWTGGSNYNSIIFKQRIEANRVWPRNMETFNPVMTLSFETASNQSGWYVVEVVNELLDAGCSYKYWEPGNGLYHQHEWTIPPASSYYFWKNSKETGLSVNFWILAGDGYRSKATLNTTWTALDSGRAVGHDNTMAGTSGKWLSFTNVQLEYGAGRTLFENRPFQEELELCLRYREFYKQMVVPGGCNATFNPVNALNWVMFDMPSFVVPKRVTPLITHSEYSSVLSYGSSLPFIDTTTYETIRPDDTFPYLDEYCLKPLYGAKVTNTLSSTTIYHGLFYDLMFDAELGMV